MPVWGREGSEQRGRIRGGVGVGGQEKKNKQGVPHAPPRLVRYYSQQTRPRRRFSAMRCALSSTIIKSPSFRDTTDVIRATGEKIAANYI